MNKLLVLLMIFVLSASIVSAIPSPGHPASSVGGPTQSEGTFGNFVYYFPNNLFVFLNLNVSGMINASQIYINSQRVLTEGDINIINKPGDNIYITYDNTSYNFNETRLNATIDARGAADTHVAGDGIYLTNDSTTMYFNETRLNATIDARDKDTIWPINETVLKNESGILGINISFWDGIYARISNLVSLVGNWSADKPSYYNKTEIDTLGNWSDDKQFYINSTTLDNSTIIRAGNTSWITSNQQHYNYTHLSNFTDDLGSRGYTHLSNFTDDIGAAGLWQNISGNAIYTAGNVGIGTTTPSQKLEIDYGDILIKGTNGWLGGGDMAKVILGDTNHYIAAKYGLPNLGGLVFSTLNASDHIFNFTNNNGDNLMVLRADTGYLGIGTSSPSQKLTVVGNANITGNIYSPDNIYGENLYVGMGSSTDNDYIYFDEPGAGGDYIYYNNAADRFYTSTTLYAEGDLMASGKVCGNRFMATLHGTLFASTGVLMASEYTTLDTEGKTYTCLDCFDPPSTPSDCTTTHGAQWYYCEFSVTC